MANQFAAEESGSTAAADGYAAAVEELESILEDLEKEDVDIDDLARKVGRAEELLRFCEERLSHAEIQVKQIVANLENELPGNTGDTGDTKGEGEGATEGTTDEER